MTKIEQKEAVRFGKKVKKKLIDMNMSQADLARQLNMSRFYLWRILNGDRSGKTYRDRIISVLGIEDAA